jgi:hypothetical protein
MQSFEITQNLLAEIWMLQCNVVLRKSWSELRVCREGIGRAWDESQILL